MHVEHSITINRPVEEVFEYVSTPENDPTWVSASLRNERTLPGPMRVGMSTKEDVKFLGQTSTDTWEVIEYEPPLVVAYLATSGLLSGGVVRARCKPVEGGTRFTHEVKYEPRGLYYKAISPVMPWLTRRLIASMDRTLKNLLEGDTSTSPSGRPESAASGALVGSVLVAAGIAVLALLLLRRRSR